MAGGGFTRSGNKKKYKGHTTNYVVMTCIVAASGGALFGYDNGITGGIVAMPGFLSKFFPDVLDNEGNTLHGQAGQHGDKDPYCTYDNQSLQWFTSSLFIAGVFAAIPAGVATRKIGRKATMLLAGLLFDVGVILMASAQNFGMLIGGRVMLGVAVAFASVAVTLYNSEMAPAHMRGRLNQIFQVVLSLGVVVAQWINLGTELLDPWGWRLSLALAGIPAIILTVGGILLPETPNSLVERGKLDEGRQVLKDIRGVDADDVDEELMDIKTACDSAAKVENPWRTILKPAYRPQLVISLTATFFQQWTGINTVIFYSPQLFISLGKTQHDALIATIVTGVVNHCATYVSLWAADHKGRRALFMAGGIQMFISLCMVAIILALFGQESWTAWTVLVFICIYISAYAWSWGPLGWLYPSEIHPLETRSAGQSICTLVNLLFSFVIGQTYLSMLCAFKWGIFLFFAGMVLFMTVFVYLFYPETRGLSIEDAPKVFRKHWFWKRYALLGFENETREDAEAGVANLTAPLMEDPPSNGHGDGEATPS